ncbi:MAG: hypothetical protein E7231_09495 [Cellulosilyticum sp.]|nr:hypothetical protein [Cellulosilyticum sp.]
MYNVLLTCRTEELLISTEQIFDSIKTEAEAETVIRILWERVPELTEQQEKELHKLGRKIRKRFNMKPIKI